MTAQTLENLSPNQLGRVGPHQKSIILIMVLNPHLAHAWFLCNGPIGIWIENLPKWAHMGRICNGFWQLYVGSKMAWSWSGLKRCQSEPILNKSVMVFDRCTWVRKWPDQDLDRRGAKVSPYGTNLWWFLISVLGFENGLIRIWREQVPTWAHMEQIC